MTTADSSVSSRRRPPRFWLKEALVVLGILAFGLFALGLPSRGVLPQSSAPVEIAD